MVATTQSYELAPELVSVALRRIGRLREQQVADRQLYESYFWDSHAAYFSPWVGSERAPDSGDEPTVARTIEELRVDGREIIQAAQDFRWRRTGSHVSSVGR